MQAVTLLVVVASLTTIATTNFDEKMAGDEEWLDFSFQNSDESGSSTAATEILDPTETSTTTELLLQFGSTANPKVSAAAVSTAEPIAETTETGTKSVPRTTEKSFMHSRKKKKPNPTVPFLNPVTFKFLPTPTQPPVGTSTSIFKTKPEENIFGPDPRIRRQEKQLNRLRHNLELDAIEVAYLSYKDQSKHLHEIVKSLHSLLVGNCRYSWSEQDHDSPSILPTCAASKDAAEKQILYYENWLAKNAIYRKRTQSILVEADALHETYAKIIKETLGNGYEWYRHNMSPPRGTATDDTEVKIYQDQKEAPVENSTQDPLYFTTAVDIHEQTAPSTNSTIHQPIPNSVNSQDAKFFANKSSKQSITNPSKPRGADPLKLSVKHQRTKRPKKLRSKKTDSVDEDVEALMKEIHLGINGNYEIFAKAFVIKNRNESELFKSVEGYLPDIVNTIVSKTMFRLSLRKRERCYLLYMNNLTHLSVKEITDLQRIGGQPKEPLHLHAQNWKFIPRHNASQFILFNTERKMIVGSAVSMSDMGKKWDDEANVILEPFTDQNKLNLSNSFHWELSLFCKDKREINLIDSSSEEDSCPSQDFYLEVRNRELRHLKLTIDDNARVFLSSKYEDRAMIDVF